MSVTMILEACRVVVLLALFIVLVQCANNKTTVPVAPPPKETRHTGAVSSLVKMLIDIPMGIVEAFKDGADALETLVVSFMRGVF